MTKRRMIALTALAITISSAPADSTTAPQVIKVSAKRFEYNPHEIVLKKGVLTVLQLTTEDRSHGFNIPAMNLRTDIMPGKISELKLVPEKSGEFDFFCDIFCGSGHEGMNGKIIVTD